jgi:hypothetical protein
MRAAGVTEVVERVPEATEKEVAAEGEIFHFDASVSQSHVPPVQMRCACDFEIPKRAANTL